MIVSQQVYWMKVLKSLVFDDMVEFEIGLATDWTPESFGADTHFLGASGAARLSSAAPRAVLGPQVLWRGPRSGRGVFWRVQHLVQHPTPKALLSSAP
mgnify:CR=1 FL=1